MTRYVDTALSPGEPILYDAKVHWAIFISPFARLFFTAVALCFVWAFVGINVSADLSSVLSDDTGASRLKRFLSTLPMMSIFGLIFLLVGAQGFIHSIIYYYNSDFVLTDRRVISKFGLMSRTTSEQRLGKVESIHVYQSFLGRLLNYGNITVTGTGSSTTTFGPMVDPIACKRAIEAQLDLKRHEGPSE